MWRRSWNRRLEARTLEQLGGATAMGFGIWSMHFIGMLAFMSLTTAILAIGVLAVTLITDIYSAELDARVTRA
ncbi:MAG: MHYT domain-containing protein [Steroidobacteraceae bacterium]